MNNTSLHNSGDPKNNLINNIIDSFGIKKGGYPIGTVRNGSKKIADTGGKGDWVSTTAEPKEDGYVGVVKTHKKLFVHTDKDAHSVTHKGSTYWSRPDESKEAFIDRAQKAISEDHKDTVRLFPNFQAASAHYNRVYHDTYSGAVQTAREGAEAKGYEIGEDDWSTNVTFGKGKPKDGETTRHSIELLDKETGKPSKKALHIQVYNTGKKYELNYYIN